MNQGATMNAKRLLLIPLLLAGLALGGCAGQVQETWTKLTSTEVSPTAVIVAANAFNAVKATATNYIRLPRCTGQNGPACRDPAVAAKIIPAVRSGTIARNGLTTFLRNNPGKLGPSGLYNALVGSTSVLNGIYAQYNIRSQ
jgi:hypothetical protein